MANPPINLTRYAAGFAGLRGQVMGNVSRRKPGVDVRRLWATLWPCASRRLTSTATGSDGSKDLAGRARILMRVDRLIHGNPGSHRNLPDGISELKIDFGPGYRVYCTRRGERLLAVDRRRHAHHQDIAMAARQARQFLE